MSDQRAGGIAWTDETWNPIRGCSRVSAGCENCYAEGVAARFSGPGLPYEWLAGRSGKGLPKWTGEVRMVPEHLADPLRWKRPRRVFVNSMSDLFHEKLTNEQIAAVFGVMAAAPQHTFQVLTKRAKRMREWFEWVAYAFGEARHTPAEGCRGEAMNWIDHRRQDGSALPGPTKTLFGYDDRWPLPNVHLGVSCENQETANERIPRLLSTPAAVRWVSAEPLIAPIDFASVHPPGFPLDKYNALHGTYRGGLEVPKLDWIVIGGESGKNARPFEIEWARDIVKQCREAEVPLFYKQGGRSNRCSHDGHGGHIECFPNDLQIREFPHGNS